ncbi:hypothetical protein ABIE66_000555 [Peribacillus sp. B2I2]
MFGSILPNLNEIIKLSGALAEDRSCFKVSSFFMALTGQVSIPVDR